MSKNLHVLIVDDDEHIRTTLAMAVKSLGWSVQTASNAKDALDTLGHLRVDAVLTDVRMESVSGIELVREIRALYPDVICVVMTAFASFENAVSAIKAGAFDYLPKPFSVDQLEHLLGKIGTLVDLLRENERLKREIGGVRWFEGLTSEGSRHLRTSIDRIAPTHVTVLLSGETGTGKTELARTIHSLSTRADKPLIEVTCTALAESLFESEIFGHVRGAFTGAIRDHVGKFELAEGGTILLDEIGELSLAAQSKLLRFLEDQVIEKVGDNKSIRLDVRILAATNKDLASLCREGRFREDLYYRLNVFELHVPPLRERVEDIPVLAMKLYHAATVRHGGEIKGLSQPFMNSLMAYPWPGNVRELRNVMERVALMSLGREPSLSDLPASVQEGGSTSGSRQNDRIPTLKEVEEEHIQRVLALESNQTRAAELLGITTVTLWRRRKEMKSA